MHQLSFQKDRQFDWTALLDLKTLYELENFDIRGEYQCRDHSFIIFFNCTPSHRSVNLSSSDKPISIYRLWIPGLGLIPQQVSLRPWPWILWWRAWSCSKLILFKSSRCSWKSHCRLFRSSELWAHWPQRRDRREVPNFRVGIRNNPAALFKFVI